MSIAVDQTEHSVRVPPVIPETHSDAILPREPGGRAIVAVHRYMSMNSAGPRGGATLLDGGEGGYAQRISLLRLKGTDTGDEDRVVSYGACEAGNPLLACCNAGFPECFESLSSLSAEAKGSSRSSRLALGPGRNER